MIPTTESLPALIVQGCTPPLHLSNFKLIAFEMDSVLIPMRCLEALILAVGRKPEMDAITESKLDSHPSTDKNRLHRSVALLEGVSVASVQAAFRNGLQLSAGASALIQACKTAGLQVMVVSSGFTVFTDRLQDVLGIDVTCANILEERDGVFTGKIADQYWGTISRDEKRQLLLATCYELGIEPAQAIAVGHDFDDLPMMGLAGLSVAYHAPSEVSSKANIAINQGGIDRLLEVFTTDAKEVTSSDFDLSVLDDLVGNDAAKFRKFALLFLSSLEDVLNQVDEGCARSDLPALAAMGHRAKSTAMNIGAEQLSRQFLLLEKTAKANDAAASIAASQSLRPMLHWIRTAIDQRLASQT